MRCILEDISKYVIKKKIQIMFLVSTIFKQWLQKKLSVNYVFFTHYIDSNFL